MNLFPKNRNFDGKDLSNQVFEMDGLGNTWVCHPDIDEKGKTLIDVLLLVLIYLVAHLRIYT